MNQLFCSEAENMNHTAASVFFLWIPNVLLSQGRTLGAMLVSRGQHRLLHGVYYVLKNPLDWLESKIVELMI